MHEISREYGGSHMEERAYSLPEDVKESLQHRLFVEKEIPPMWPYPVERVSYMDGCKIYLENGGWLSARFSGTEPLLRIFCEMPTQKETQELCDSMAKYFQI